MRLQGKVAVITGAARGIGRACALRFAREGAAVVLVDIAANIDGVPYPLGSSSQLEHTASCCRALGFGVLPVAADIRDAAAVQQITEMSVSRFGTIDVLVNSAGIVSPSGRGVHEIAERDWSVIIDIDLSGTWRMLKAVAPYMLRRRAGSIVNISSTAGTVGYRNFAAYVAAKHGVVGLTRAAALDLAPFNVRVNALCPGSVRDSLEYEGEMLKEIARCLDVPAAEHERIFSKPQPMNALVEAEDVSSAATWLASDDAKSVTGAIIPVDGGFTAR